MFIRPELGGKVQDVYFSLHTVYRRGVLEYALICKPLMVYRFYCMALFHSQTRRHAIKEYGTYMLFKTK